ncbi:hypothetical protein EJB05_11380, partial [Eragrostis curvula]
MALLSAVWRRGAGGPDSWRHAARDGPPLCCMAARRGGPFHGGAAWEGRIAAAVGDEGGDVGSGSSIALAWFAGREAAHLESLTDDEVARGVVILASSLLCFLILASSLLHCVRSDGNDAQHLKGINSYRSSQKVPALSENKNASCLADQLAKQFKPPLQVLMMTPWPQSSHRRL